MAQSSVKYPKPELREDWTTVAGLRMFTRVTTIEPQERATALVLLHGLAVSGRYMVPLARELASSYRVYIPDLPGFGNSERPKKVPSIEELASALAEWMRLQSVASAVVVANSMGCQVLVEVVRNFPELVKAAVMLGPTMDPSGGVLGQPFRLIKDQFAERPALIAIQALDYMIFGPLRTFGMFKEALRHPMRERLADMSVPTLVMRGTRDSIVTQSWAEEVTARIPSARLKVIEDAGHAINYNSAAIVAREVEQFIEGLSVMS